MFSMANNMNRLLYRCFAIIPIYLGVSYFKFDRIIRYINVPFANGGDVVVGCVVGNCVVKGATVVCVDTLVQLSPTSSLCPQSVTSHPLKEQSFKEVSLPIHCTSSIWILPLPGIMFPIVPVKLRYLKPSMWHATVASLSSH